MSADILPAITQGLILSLVALGIMVPFRLLHTPDLSVEGAYPLGGSMAAALLTMGFSPLLGACAAIGAGGLLGLSVAVLHRKLDLHPLLAGILLNTMIYSVNLHLMGRPNVPLFDEGIGVTEGLSLLGGTAFLLILLFEGFFRTEKGLIVLATGQNPLFAQRHGIQTTYLLFGGFFVGGALAGLGGALMVQTQHYADIGMGYGIVIHGLAALMLGEMIVQATTIQRQIWAPLVGGLFYQLLQMGVMMGGFDPSDLKLVTGGIVLSILVLQKKHFKTG